MPLGVQCYPLMMTVVVVVVATVVSWHVFVVQRLAFVPILAIVVFLMLMMIVTVVEAMLQYHYCYWHVALVTAAPLVVDFFVPNGARDTTWKRPPRIVSKPPWALSAHIAIP